MTWLTDLVEDAVAVNAAVAALAGRDLRVMTGQEGVDLLGQLCTAMNALDAVLRRFSAALPTVAGCETSSFVRWRPGNRLQLRSEAV